MAKPQYTKPTSQLDLEERQKPDYVPPSQLTPGINPQPSDNGYIGVDPIYQNYANDTEKPYLAEKGPEAKIEKNYVTDDVDTSKGATAEGEAPVEDDEPEDEGKDEGKTTTAAQGGAATPPSGPTPS